MQRILRQVLEKSGVKPQGLAPPEEAEKVVGCSMGALWLNQGADELRSRFGYDMAVSQNKGTPKWMVYNGKPY